MSDAILVRATPRDMDSNGTFGVLWVGGFPVCLTCERPWDDNEPDKSCIDTGTYTCIRHVSAKFPDGDTWEVTGVSGRTGILIHPANDAAELEGCIAPGLIFGILAMVPAVLQSRQALAMLNAKLPDTFTLTIIE